jgi:transcriptional regulator with XRE-family HTH domain
MFGEALRERRQAAGLSLSQFAALIHYSKGYVSKIESGDRTANAALARQCDVALGARGELAVLVTDGQAEAVPEPAAGGDLGAWRLSLAPDGTGEFTRSESAADALTLLAAPGSADADVLLPLLTGRFEHTRALGQVCSPRFVLPTLISETHLVRNLAARSGAPALWRLAGQFTEYVGWMMQELGVNREAMWWTGQAVRLAEAGGDESLRPYALVRRADVTMHDDDPRSTLELAGRAGSDPAATARVRGLAAEREAQAYALQGDADACFRALDRSAELLADAARSGGPVLGTTRTPDQNTMARGWCLVDLSRPAEAAEALERGLAGVRPEASRVRARYGLRAALAWVAAGEVERACALVAAVASDVRQVDSATVRHDVRLLGREFRRRAAVPAVRDLLPEVAELARGSSVGPG